MFIYQKCVIFLSQHCSVHELHKVFVVQFKAFIMVLIFFYKRELYHFMAVDEKEGRDFIVAKANTAEDSVQSLQRHKINKKKNEKLSLMATESDSILSILVASTFYLRFLAKKCSMDLNLLFAILVIQIISFLASRKSPYKSHLNYCCFNLVLRIVCLKIQIFPRNVRMTMKLYK